MTISRRDTILLAVLINVGLLALLFITAIHHDDEVALQDGQLSEALTSKESVSETVQPISVVSETPQPVSIALEPSQPQELALPVDEIDRALKAHSREGPQEIASVEKVVEITVKRGDTLDKIAKANKTTVKEIQKLNGLEHDRLSVGQTLKIPMATTQKETMAAAHKETMATVKKENIATQKENSSEGPVYYTIKSGDSPWKIAKQFKVRYEDILKLNNLTEEKARNLKIGERIRIK